MTTLIGKNFSNSKQASSGLNNWLNLRITLTFCQATWRGSKEGLNCPITQINILTILTDLTLSKEAWDMTMWILGSMSQPNHRLNLSLGQGLKRLLTGALTLLRLLNANKKQSHLKWLRNGSHQSLMKLSVIQVEALFKNNHQMVKLSLISLRSRTISSTTSMLWKVFFRSRIPCQEAVTLHNRREIQKAWCFLRRKSTQLIGSQFITTSIIQKGERQTLLPEVLTLLLKETPQVQLAGARALLLFSSMTSTMERSKIHNTKITGLTRTESRSNLPSYSSTTFITGKRMILSTRTIGLTLLESHLIPLLHWLIIFTMANSKIHSTRTIGLTQTGIGTDNH